MSTLIGTPRLFDPTTDDFESWIKLFERFLIANSLDKTKASQEDRCLAILHSCLGLPTFTLLESLLSPVDPADSNYKDCVDVLTKHYKPAPKAMSERYKFACRKQLHGETVAAFLADLRKLAVTCKFGAALNNHLRDQFAFGLSSESTQRKIFAEDDNVTLDKVVQIATAAKAAAKSTTLVRNGQQSSEQEVLVTRSKQSKKKPDFGSKKPAQHQQQQQGNASCRNCGSKQHTRSADCPHKDVICFKCSKKGHFAKCCLSSGKQSQPRTHAKTVDSLVQKVNQVKHRGLITVKILVNGIPHNMEFDTGCGSSLLSESFWKNELGSPSLQPSDFQFRTYTEQVFKPLGELKAKVQYQNQEISHTFYVVAGVSLFGRDLMRSLKLDWSEIKNQCNSVSPSPQIALDALLHEYQDVFGPTNVKIKNFKAKVVLKEDAVPRFLKARQIPFALRQKVDHELDLLEKDGKIERVQHSDWASPLVVVPKPNGRVRITGDFKHTINSQLNVTQYPLARVDELMTAIAGGEKFSKMDGADGFYQIELEEACKKFLVINTHRGLYRYNVLPQGIASSPAIFQEFMDQMLGDIQMTRSFMDDSICSGKNDQEHLQHLKSVFQRMRESNYRLAKSKCVFLKPSIEYLGFVISKDGISTAPSKVEAIQQMKKPTSVSEVKSFLGLVNFYAKFVPFLSDQCEPLYSLTRKEVKFKWSAACDQAFRKVKSLLSSSQILVHHDQNQPIGISCDASPKGLGVVLFHKGTDNAEHPIAFASKILSPTEARYSQIEREALSIIFGIKRFHQYLCGRRFTLITDHKPLLAIFGANTQVPSYTANRLHRWGLYLSEFQYDIEYRRTNLHGNADALSRLGGDNVEEIHFIGEVDNEVNTISNELFDVLPVTAKQIRQHSSRDKLLSQVYQHINIGWPEKVDKNSGLHPFFVHRDELQIVQGVIMWGIRVIVPVALRRKLLESLHETHSGIVQMKSLAREFIWWPKIDQEIEVLAKSCAQCAAERPNPPSAPLHPWKFYDNDGVMQIYNLND